MKISFLDLGNQPLANSFLIKKEINKKEEYYFPLIAEFDTDSYLVSLREQPPPDMMFNSNYIYSSSHSSLLVNHFRSIAERLKKQLDRFGNILEIGSNDGIFIKHFGQGQGICVEPCSNFAKITQDMGYKTYDEFWTYNLMNKIKEDHGLMDIVYSANCMCHIYNIKQAFANIKSILKDTGIFVFEDPSLLEMMKKNSYDQIYDEHAHIFSVLSLNKLLNDVGLRIFYIEKLNIHGGSNRIWATHIDNNHLIGSLDSSAWFSKNMSLEQSLNEELNYGLHRTITYFNFANRIEESRYKLIDLLLTLKKLNKKIIGFGATSKSTVVFNYCNIKRNLIEYVIDEMSSKQGKYYPRVHIPIIPCENKYIKDADYIFLGAWNFYDDINKKLRVSKNWAGSFITHIPEVKIL